MSRAIRQERLHRCQRRNTWFFLLKNERDNGISVPQRCHRERKRKGLYYDKLSCWLDLTEEDVQRVVRLDLEGKQVAGYASFKDGVTKSQAAYLLRIGRQTLFGGTPQNYKQVKDAFRGLKRLCPYEVFEKKFDAGFDDLYKSLHRVVQIFGGVQNPRAYRICRRAGGRLEGFNPFKQGCRA